MGKRVPVSNTPGLVLGSLASFLQGGLPAGRRFPIRIFLTTKMVCSESRGNPDSLTTERTEDTEKEKSAARF